MDTLSVKRVKISRECQVLNLSDPRVVEPLRRPGQKVILAPLEFLAEVSV